MDQELFQNVFDQITGTLPETWEKVTFYAAYIGTSYTMKYYVSTANEKNVSCFELPGITKAALVRSFLQVDKVLSKVRVALDGSNRWNVLTMVAEKNGHFKAFYDYADLSENAIEYERSWRKKYLAE